MRGKASGMDLRLSTTAITWLSHASWVMRLSTAHTQSQQRSVGRLVGHSFSSHSWRPSCIKIIALKHKSVSQTLASVGALIGWRWRTLGEASNTAKQLTMAWNWCIDLNRQPWHVRMQKCRFMQTYWIQYDNVMRVCMWICMWCCIGANIKRFVSNMDIWPARFAISRTHALL